MNTNNINQFFNLLGFNKEQQEIYTYLVRVQESTILSISKETKIERTKVYREVESMISNGYLFERIEYKRRYITPCSIEILKEHAQDYIESAKQIEQALPNILGTFTDLQNLNQPTTVKYYKGQSGIKQVLWNQLSAKDEILTYSYRDLIEIVGAKFFKEWRKEYELKKLKLRDLRSDSFLKSQKEKGYTPLPIKNDYVKYIDPEVLDIITEIDIYNNTVVVFNWYEGEVYAVEITNEKLAKMQKQIFNAFWKLGKEYNEEKKLKGYKVFNEENRG